MADAKVSISFPITIQRTSQVNHGYFTNSPLEAADVFGGVAWETCL